MKLLDFERQFNVANKTAASITEQNGRVVRAQTEVEDPEFLDIALDGISEEQTETVETLTDFVNALPYEELANEYDRRQTELAQIKNDLESGAELETDQASRLAIKSLAALVSEISPRREKQVEELAEKRIKQLDDESKTAL
jgi:choline kinase